MVKTAYKSQRYVPGCALAAGVMTGCGADAEPTPTVTVTKTVRAEQTPPQSEVLVLTPEENRRVNMVARGATLSLLNLVRESGKYKEVDLATGTPFHAIEFYDKNSTGFVNLRRGDVFGGDSVIIETGFNDNGKPTVNKSVTFFNGNQYSGEKPLSVKDVEALLGDERTKLTEVVQVSDGMAFKYTIAVDGSVGVAEGKPYRPLCDPEFQDFGDARALTESKSIKTNLEWAVREIDR